MRIFDSLLELRQAAGEELGVTEWVPIEQERVTGFAQVTEDRQWIHVDEATASHSSYGGTIAHGFLTLSLVPFLLRQLYRVDEVRMAMNYGLDKVRFPSVTRVGSRVRGSAKISEVVPLDKAVQVAFEVTVTAEGEEKPACVATYIVRFVE